MIDSTPPSLSLRSGCCWLLIVFLANVVANGQDLLLADGETFSGELVACNDGQLTLSTETGAKSFAPGEWLRWRYPLDPQPRPRLYFGGQSMLVAKRDWTGKVPVTIEQSSVTIDNETLGKVKLDRNGIRCLIIEAAREAGLASKLLSEAEIPSKVDRVWLVEGDLLTGRVRSFDGTSLNLEFAGEEVPVLASKIAAVAFAAGNPGDAAKPEYLAGLADGSLLEATNLQFDEQQLTIDAFGAEWRTEKPERLAFLQSLAPPAVYLSDLEPADFKHTPYFSGEWPLARDRSLSGESLRAAGHRYAKGIAMHSASRAVYRVPEGAQRFLAEVALDDSTQGEGSAVFRVYRATREGLQLATETEVVRGGEAPQPIAVEVADTVAIVLVVDYADDGDQLDRANWLDARFTQ